MFDFGFSELLFIGILALVVMGPARLPSMARTLGHWIGRAQSMMRSISTQLQESSPVDNIKKLQQDVESCVQDLHTQTQHQNNNGFEHIDNNDVVSTVDVSNHQQKPFKYGRRARCSTHQQRPRARLKNHDHG